MLRLLNPRLHFEFHEVVYEGKRVVVLEIPRAVDKPVQFQGLEFIRVGSYRQKLKDYPHKERELWRIFDTTPFELMIARDSLSVSKALDLLDASRYFELLGQPQPDDALRIAQRLAEDRMVVQNAAGQWDITNLGALLFSRDMEEFPGLSRKRLRIIIYEGRGRLKTLREEVISAGYAAAFEKLIGLINLLLPRREVIGQALRQSTTTYPELAIRELVANALIHQNFTVTGSGPMIEVFDDRIEITNPGEPLVNTQRFLDSPPRSRNEALASFMRRVGICEERGSGIDKVVSETEDLHLPPPLFEVVEGSTRAVLFAARPLNEMNRADQVRACYLHACLRYVEYDPMTNSSLRQRFAILEHNSATASRIIKMALEDGIIKPFDPKQGKKYAKYLPFWA